MKIQSFSDDKRRRWGGDVYQKEQVESDTIRNRKDRAQSYGSKV